MVRETMSAAACAWAALCCSSIACAQLPAYERPSGDEMRAHFIDVGQGAAVLLEFECAAALIDTGGEVNPTFDAVRSLQSYLDAFFARRADLQKTFALLVLTHPHVDHNAGIKMVLNGYRVRAFVDDGLETSKGGKNSRDAHRFARSRRSQMRWQVVTEPAVDTTAGLASATIDPIACGQTDPQFRVLWGALSSDDGWSAETLENENDSSVVVRLDFGEASFLFPGDLEQDVHTEFVQFFTQDCSAASPLLCPLDVDVFHVAHHGAENGTTAELVAAMTPKIAVISMGPWNRRVAWSAYQHGHPRRKAIDRLLASDGVSEFRVPKTVMIANRGKSTKPNRTPQFSETLMDRAIYGTGWDGSVVVNARADGTLSVDTEH